MKRPVYILLTLLLPTAVAGCRHAVDRRLVLADTLMWVQPDSSLVILNAVNRDSLTSKEDLPTVTYDDDLNQLYVYFGSTGTIDIEYLDPTGTPYYLVYGESNNSQ